MTEASHNVFVDRRTTQQQAAELATQVLYWYDDPHQGKMRVSKNDKNKSRNGRVRTNALAITTDGSLVVARVSCFIKDNFSKKLGRMKVEAKILGRSQDSTLVTVDSNLPLPEACAAAFAEVFPGDEMGSKRAYNVGKIFAAYKADIERRANELDDFNG